jgi:hypothetical protein
MINNDLALAKIQQATKLIAGNPHQAGNKIIFIFFREVESNCRLTACTGARNCQFCIGTVDIPDLRIFTFTFNHP